MPQQSCSSRISALIGQRILFLGAHADDIEIGCGGTAAKVAAAGRGVAFAQAADCGPARRQEARAAAALLDLSEANGKLFFSPIPDGRLEERKDVLRNWLAEVAERFRPDTVFVHRGDDSHPDHVAVYEAAIRGLVHHTILLYPIPKLAAQATAFQPTCYEDISVYMDRKLELCACHVSQAGKGIYLDPEHLRSIARVAHQSGFGRTGGYAEAFRLHVARSPDEGESAGDAATGPGCFLQPAPARSSSVIARPAAAGRSRRRPPAQPKATTAKSRRRSSGSAPGGITMNIGQVTGQVIGRQDVQGDVNNSFGR